MKQIGPGGRGIMVERSVGKGWMADSDLLSVFPTLVWKIQINLEHRRDMDLKIREVLDRARQGLPALIRGEGWQSERDLHRLAEFSDLNACVQHASGGVMRFLKIGYESFEITGCWINVLAPGAQHRIHAHPNNFLSGVYYVQVHEGADTICFHDPRSQTGIIRPPVTELTRENTDQVVVNVSEGTLLLFPAYLQHSVEANGSTNLRISVSFNVMFSAFTENLSTPLW